MNLQKSKLHEDLFIHDDPSLNPYASVVKARKERFLRALDEINSEYGSLICRSMILREYPFVL